MCTKARKHDGEGTKLYFKQNIQKKGCSLEKNDSQSSRVGSDMVHSASILTSVNRHYKDKYMSSK